MHLTIGARSLRTTNFKVCGCRFANDFFCKVTAHGSLIYRWYYWKVFAVNFYASYFVSRGNSIWKKLIRLNWEKVVYWLLFTLTNTLEGYPNFDPFGRYFNKNYWERPRFTLLVLSFSQVTKSWLFKSFKFGNGNRLSDSRNKLQKALE